MSLNGILDTMMENIITYVWIDVEDNMYAVLISSDDIDKAKMFTEYGDGEKADTFDRFLYLLRGAGIDYYDISSNLDVYENG